MNVVRQGIREEGYTLIETLVAMAVFVTVLIPCAVTIGNLMVERGSEEVTLAFHVAVREMTRTGVSADFSEQISQEEAFNVKRTVSRGTRYVEVSIVVAAARRPEKNLVHLSKTFLLFK